MLNGFPTMDPRFRKMFGEQTNSTLQNLGGNGFPSTIIAAFIIAITFCFQEGTGSEDNESLGLAGAAECEAAVSLLKRARKSVDP